MQYYIMLIAAAILLAVDFIIQKSFQRRTDGTAYDCLVFTCLFGVFEAVIFFAANGFKLHFTPFSCIMASVSSILIMSYIMLGFYIMKSESVAHYTLFVMTGGMILPYIYGLIFLDEGFLWRRMLGLLLIVAAIVINNADGKKASIKKLLVCAGVFVLNGAVGIITKEHQLNAVGVNDVDFIIYTGISRAIVSAIALLILRKKVNFKNYNAKTALLPLASSIVIGVSFLLQLIPAKFVPASVLFPFITGGSIVFTAVAGRLVVKEKITKRTAIGLAICLAGTCMFL